MIIFQKLKFQNFMSYGNTWTEINLNDNKNTLIVGKNGSGKSTFLDALTFVLYGKPFRNINKPQLVNSINDKNMLVEIDFSIGKKHYTIKRGIKPNIFDIMIDGELLKQDSLIKDYQSILENEILKINYKSFCQIVVLGSGNYTPFMDLPAAARRNIIEDLLDLQVFSSMNILLKDRVQGNKEELEQVENDIKIVNSNLNLHEEHINSLKKDISKEAKELIKSADREKQKSIKIEEQIEKLSKSKLELVEKTENLNDLNKKLYDITEACNRKVKEIEILNKQKVFYEKSCSCPTCKQDIEEQFKLKMIESFNKSIEKANGNIDLGKKSIKKIQDKLSKLQKLTDEINEISNKINKLNMEKMTAIQLMNNFVESHVKLMNKMENIDYSKQEELTMKLLNHKNSKQKLIESKEVLSVASQLLKDGGIKTLIIKQYIPVMNKIINQYLNHMNFFIEFTLDENFTEIIKSRHRDDFSYSSFSEGEKARINLAILFAWRTIAKMRNTSNTNILVFDEIFDGSLDNDGTDDFMKILHTLSPDTNVFIISHKVDNISDKFQKILKFEKYKNFSQMEVA